MALTHVGELVRVIKTYKNTEEALWAYTKLIKLPAIHRPHGLYYSKNELSYDFIQDHSPIDWRQVYNIMTFAWNHPLINRYRSIDRKGYYEYVCERTHNNRVHRIMKHVYDAVFTPIKWCHGDLTFSNVVGQKLIDPGHCRGLPCRELDISKMMQSVDGFGVVYRGEPQPIAYPRMPFRPIHHVLLLSHYVRLLHHVKHEPSLAFANQRIDELCNLLLLSHTL